MAQLSPYIGFNGNCREAMTFYKDCLGGDLTFQTAGEAPAEAGCPEGTAGEIMHSMLISNGIVIMATDMGNPEGYEKGNNISLTLNCDSEEEIRSLFDKLSEGGKIGQQLKLEFWGGLFGYLTDKFGIVWMFNYQQTP